MSDESDVRNGGAENPVPALSHAYRKSPRNQRLPGLVYRIEDSNNINFNRVKNSLRIFYSK